VCLASLRLRPRAPDPGRSVVVGMLDALAALRAVGTAVVAYADAADEAATACERACGEGAAPAEVEAVAEVRAATRALRQRYSAMVAHPTSSAGLAGAAGAAGAALVHGAGVTPAAALAALASSVQRGLGRGEQGGAAAAETRLQLMADALIRGAWAAGAAGNAARARAGQPAPARADGGGAAAPGACAGGPAAADQLADGHQVRPGALCWRPARAACAPAQRGWPGALTLGRRARARARRQAWELLAVGTSALPPGADDAARSWGHEDAPMPHGRRWGGRALVLCARGGRTALIAQAKLPGPVHALCLHQCAAPPGARGSSGGRGAAAPRRCIGRAGCAVSECRQLATGSKRLLCAFYRAHHHAV
jgi:hypothetical protein